jgi:hypothetical protein
MVELIFAIKYHAAASRNVLESSSSNQGLAAATPAIHTTHAPGPGTLLSATALFPTGREAVPKGKAPAEERRAVVCRICSNAT